MVKIVAVAACVLVFAAFFFGNTAWAYSDEERPPVVSRKEWGAKAPTRAYQTHLPTRITIHHQGVFSTRQADTKRRLKNMQAFHQGKSREFADIAYHFIIDRRGTIYEGRPVTTAGETRTDYDPSGHLLICLLGDFEKQTPTSEQQTALVTLVRWAMTTFKISQERIGGHRDYAHTTCPGKHLYALIKSERFIQQLLIAKPR